MDTLVPEPIRRLTEARRLRSEEGIEDGREEQPEKVSRQSHDDQRNEKAQGEAA